VATEFFDWIKALETNVTKALLGKPESVHLAIVALLAEGHILIEDAPGVGKTSLAKALAKSLNCDFKRLQCTPDMLPSDILGSSVYLPHRGEFEFRHGPIFSHIVVVDEINRTTPRTQSALLEAMNEGQVSIEGHTYTLKKPFFVLATQNPFEFEGTFALPENQLDRFMLCIEIGYPELAIEKEILTSHRNGEPVDQLQPAMTLEQLAQLQKAVRDVRVEDSINEYLLRIVGATRNHPELSLGISTRGALTLYRAAQSLALVDQRTFVIPDDIKRLAAPVLAHRAISKGLIREGQRDRVKDVIRQILEKTPVPK